MLCAKWPPLFYMFLRSSLVSKKPSLSLCTVCALFNTGCHICGGADHKRQSCQKYGMHRQLEKSQKPLKRYLCHLFFRNLMIQLIWLDTCGMLLCDTMLVL